MIRGTINEFNSCYISLTVSGNRGSIEVRGLLDTGFEGYLCLPISLAVPLGLELSNIIGTELADGTIIEDELVFSGKLLWGDESIDVEIILTRSDDTLSVQLYLLIRKFI